MYLVDNKANKYHIFDLKENRYIREFFTFEELIDYMANFQVHETSMFDSKYTNIMLNDINMNFKDKNSDLIYYCQHEQRYKLYRNQQLRRYVILDGYGRIIDIRNHFDKICQRSEQFEDERTFAFVYRSYYYINRMRRYVGKGYKGAEFRKDPIPFTGKRGYYISYRPIRTTNERRQNVDKEIEQYVRGKRRYKTLPTSYDDIYRHNDKCWKTQSRNKKQWMKQAFANKVDYY